MSTLNVFADHHDIMPASGVKRWLLVTNHKDIDTTYLVFSLKMFFVSGAMAVLIRAELSQPGLQLVDPTLAGMPQRIPDYFVQFTAWNMASSIGGFYFRLSQTLFALVIVQCVRGGKQASAQVWDGAMTRCLEWTIPSSAPDHSFSTTPHIPWMTQVSGSLQLSGKRAANLLASMAGDWVQLPNESTRRGKR
jgi:heme/copper-type cytochrome/quinol oxidase subunit 1